MRLAVFLGIIALLWNAKGYTQNVEHLDSSHVHEAFMNSEASITLLTAIPQSPPSPLQENIPQQEDPQSVWVSGYWDWSLERNEFVWCSGSWRRPPPDHQWIPGSWQKLDEGWVRLKGFWSKIPEQNLTYLPKSPPDPYDENPTNRPGDDYFWMSGYWKYERNKYVWYSGKWEKLDEDWIYVPPKYVWRPKGYIFVPAFWDWPLDERGTAYVCVSVPKGERQISYTSDMIVEPMALIEGCLLYYPDYYYFYFYYWYFHVDWWWGCAWCPPWWGWIDWWWMPWWDHWGLWWWWVHPGFPAPWWLDPWLMDMIFGPPWPLMNVMKSVHPPLVIGPNGLIPPTNLIDAVGNDKPVFPEDPTDIQEEAGKDVEQGNPNRPTGPKIPNEQLDENVPPAPQTTPRPPSGVTPGQQPATPPTTVETPPKPSRPPVKRPTPRPSRPPTTTYPPTYYPPAQKPSRPPSYQPQRPIRPPSYQPQTPPSYQPQRPIRPPSQTGPYYPQRPISPPSYQPSRPETKPPSQTRPTYPPQQTPSYPQYTPQTPSYTPQRPSYTPQTIQPPQQQYTPQTPQFQTTPRQMQRFQRRQTPSNKYY